MSSGVKVNPLCVSEYQDLKMKKNHRYIIYAINKQLTEVEVLKTADTSATVQDFIAEFKEAAEQKQCRYGIVDFPYKTPTQEKSKIIFFYWGPEDATTKQKMVYSATKDGFRRELGDGFAHILEAHDDEDLCISAIEERLLGADRTK